MSYLKRCGIPPLGIKRPVPELHLPVGLGLNVELHLPVGLGLNVELHLPVGLGL
jgi:hypothetical protein